MSEEVFVQLFWFIFMVTAFCGMLVVGGLVFEHLERWDYRHYVKLQKAKKTWARMLSGEK